jgi:alpha-mannosidase
VIDEAHKFNSPFLVTATDAPAAGQSWFSVDSPSVIIDTVKKAEDSDAIIVRLYESHGGRCRAKLTSALPIKSATLCNLLEEDQAPLAWNDGAALEFTPFKLVTLKLSL